MQKILAVDDDESILELITQFFSRQNYKVITCMRGTKVTELAINEEPDLIILDINLPDVDGLSVLKTLKTRPITSFIPVIMLTAQVSTEFQVSGLVSGADDYVTKPFDLEVLNARVINALRHSLLLTRLKHDQFNLLSYLLRIYKKRGYQVFTKLLGDYSGSPRLWRGYVPDMIIQKHEKLRCFNFETTQSILEESFIDRLSQLAECDKNAIVHFEATIIVRSKDNWKIVKRLISENSIPIKVKFIKKHIQRNQFV